MKKNDFYQGLSDILETVGLRLDGNTILKELDQYDSLSILGIIAFVDEKFKKKLTAENFKAVTTVQSLMQMIGEENFE